MPKVKGGNRVLAITGSPHPSRLVSPAQRVRPRARKMERAASSQDGNYLAEVAMDAAADERAIAYRELRWPMTDYECEHERLPGDQTPPCGCWPEEGDNLMDDLMGVIREMSELGLPAHVKTQHKTLYSCGTIVCKTVMFTAAVDDDGRCPSCGEPGTVLRRPIPSAS